MTEVPPPPTLHTNEAGGRLSWARKRFLKLPLWAWITIALILIGAASSAGEDNSAPSASPGNEAIQTASTKPNSTKSTTPDTVTMTTDPSTTTSPESSAPTTSLKAPTTTKIPAPTPTVPTTSESPITASPSPTTARSTETVSQKNARRSAESYLRYSAFSRSGLIDQLLYEGYSQEDAEYAVGAVAVDWNEQSFKSA